MWPQLPDVSKFLLGLAKDSKGMKWYEKYVASPPLLALLVFRRPHAHAGSTFRLRSVVDRSMARSGGGGRRPRSTVALRGAVLAPRSWPVHAVVAASAGGSVRRRARRLHPRPAVHRGGTRSGRKDGSLGPIRSIPGAQCAVRRQPAVR